MTIRELYQNSLKRITNDMPEIAVRTLLLKSQRLSSMSDLYCNFDMEIQNLDEFEMDFARLLKGEPEAYIVHQCTFLQREFYVDNRVLIPRSETEEWMDILIQKMKKEFPDHFSFLDIGTGSGVLAISIQKEFPQSQGIAIDISSQALEVAKMNAEKLGANITFLQGNMLEPLKNNHRKFRLIVSNPPYIEDIRDVEQSVLSYEPHIALFAEHGIDYYEQILQSISSFLEDEYWIVFEINYDQKERLEELTKRYLPSSQYTCMKDMYGKWRSFWIWNKL